MDFYQLLDIPRAASPEEIEDRYHLLAKKYHPDIAKSSGAHEQFIKIKKAYETLKDPQKRKLYDKSLPPEEMATELPLNPEDSGFQTPDLESSSSVDADLSFSGSRRTFKSTSIAYVPFKTSSGANTSEQPASTEKNVDWSKYVFSGKRPVESDLPVDNSNMKSSSWKGVKVKYEGMEDESDDSQKKCRFSISSGLRKAILFIFVLTGFLAALSIFSPGTLNAIGLGIVVETFGKVMLLAKSLFK